MTRQMRILFLVSVVVAVGAVAVWSAAPAARVGDMHTCPLVTGIPPVPHVGGPILTGSPTVLIGGMPAARVGDTASCVGAVDVIVTGATTVLINGRPAARMGDTTAHGGVIIQGCPTVLIGP